MRKFFIALCVFFCFSHSFGQNKDIKKNIKKDDISVKELIQGKWQSVDDRTNFLVFDKGERKEIGGGMKTWEAEEYILSNKCLNESEKENGFEPETDKYISCKESDMCWYIVSINNNFLTLSYMGRGNTLKYKRVK